ncbi:hypothetical protein [Neotabrizicola sp. VNH66]|uniref:hypothetical protein n=1 Tax=Neotabrizicola sp. VNH66 TaxID=3400918 RepID=UPI003C02AFBD
MTDLPDDPFADSREELARLTAEIARLKARADLLRQTLAAPSPPPPRPGWPIRRCGTAV